MGTDRDDIFVALYDPGGSGKEGRVVKAFDADSLTPLPGPDDQTKARLNIKADDVVPPGTYLLMFRVNGQQARNSPEVALHA